MPNVLFLCDHDYYCANSLFCELNGGDCKHTCQSEHSRNKIIFEPRHNFEKDERFEQVLNSVYGHTYIEKENYKMSEEKKEAIIVPWSTIRTNEIKKILSGNFEFVDDPNRHEYLIEAIGHGAETDQILCDILELEDLEERRKNIAEYLSIEIAQELPANEDLDFPDLGPREKEPSLRPAIAGAIYSCNPDNKLENPRWLHIVTQDLRQFQFLLTEDFVRALKSVIEYYEEDSQKSQTV